MNQIDKELLEKFNKIISKQQCLERQSVEQNAERPSSVDQFGDESISNTNYESTTEPQSNLNSISTVSNSSLSHSSSNASSISVPIVHHTPYTLTNNLKNQFINSINQNYQTNHSTHSQQSNSHQSNNHQSNDHQSNDQQTNSESNNQQTSRSSGTQSNQSSNELKSTQKSTDSTDEHSSLDQLTNEDRRASYLIGKLNSLTMNEQVNGKLNKPLAERSNSSEPNLNDSTIAPISLSSLASLAKHSNQSDSNISDTTSDSNNDNSMEPPDLVVTNSITNIRSNPFLQHDQKIKILFKSAKEIRDSEKNYVDALQLICVKYRQAVQQSISASALDQLLQPFNIIFQLNTVLLGRFNHCIKNWQKEPKIANVLVELGPFLKHYADFFTKFEKINNNFAEMKRKYSGKVIHPFELLLLFCCRNVCINQQQLSLLCDWLTINRTAFREATEHFEQQPICNKLTLNHYMLKPIQRIGQYKLLIEKYLKYLKSEPRHPDYANAVKALSIVTKAAEYSNERMKENENFTKLLAIQQCIIGGYKNPIIKPYRRLIKQSILYKISRKVKQERLFILCNDCLIYLTIIKENTYKVNHEMSLSGMRISSPEQDAFQNEILIRSSQRSIRVVTSSLDEKEEWMNEINRQIQQTQSILRRRSTLTNRDETAMDAADTARPVCLGEEAPIWIPDERVCTSGTLYNVLQISI